VLVYKQKAECQPVTRVLRHAGLPAFAGATDAQACKLWAEWYYWTFV